MIPVRVTPPADRPVTLGEVKQHAVADDFSDDDLILEGLLDAAIAHFDGYAGVLGRCLMEQQWKIGQRCWQRRIVLPFPDVSVVKVSYRDSGNEVVEVSETEFELLQGPRGSEVIFRDSFTTPSLFDDTAEPITITFTVGYGDAEDVPRDIKTAILILTAFWYKYREGVGKDGELPFGVSLLTAKFRRINP